MDLWTKIALHCTKWTWELPSLEVLHPSAFYAPCRICSFALHTFIISLHCSTLCRIERTGPMHWGKALNEFHAYLILAYFHASLIFAYPWPSDHICLCNPDQAIMTSDRSGIAGAMLYFDIGSLYSLKIQGLYRTQKWKEGCEMSFFVQTTLKLWQGRRVNVCARYVCVHICRGGWQKVIRAGFRWVEAVLMAGFIDNRQLNFISFPHRH